MIVYLSDPLPEGYQIGYVFSQDEDDTVYYSANSNWMKRNETTYSTILDSYEQRPENHEKVNISIYNQLGEEDIQSVTCYLIPGATYLNVYEGGNPITELILSDPLSEGQYIGEVKSTDEDNPHVYYDGSELVKSDNNDTSYYVYDNSISNYEEVYVSVWNELDDENITSITCYHSVN